MECVDLVECEFMSEVCRISSIFSISDNAEKNTPAVWFELYDNWLKKPLLHV